MNIRARDTFDTLADAKGAVSHSAVGRAWGDSRVRWGVIGVATPCTNPSETVINLFAESVSVTTDALLQVAERVGSGQFRTEPSRYRN